MKRFLSTILVLILTFSLAAAEDYTPALNMTIDEFMTRYNALGSALGSSLIALIKPDQWTKHNQYNVAWFSPDSKSGVIMLLLSADHNSGTRLDAGLDCVQVVLPLQVDYLSFLTVSERCSRLFSEELLGVSMGPYFLINVLQNYYENNYEEKGWSSLHQLDVDGNFYMQFFKEQNKDVFEITGNVSQ